MDQLYATIQAGRKEKHCQMLSQEQIGKLPNLVTPIKDNAVTDQAIKDVNKRGVTPIETTQPLYAMLQNDRNSIVRLEDQSEIGKLPDLLAPTRNTALTQECESTIRRTMTANQYMGKGNYDMAQYFLGRPLTDEEKGSNMVHAQETMTFNTVEGQQKAAVVASMIKQVNDFLAKGNHTLAEQVLGRPLTVEERTSGRVANPLLPPVPITNNNTTNNYYAAAPAAAPVGAVPIASTPLTAFVPSSILTTPLAPSRGGAPAVKGPVMHSAIPFRLPTSGPITPSSTASFITSAPSIASHSVASTATVASPSAPSAPIPSTSILYDPDEKYDAAERKQWARLLLLPNLPSDPMQAANLIKNTVEDMKIPAAPGGYRPEDILDARIKQAEDVIKNFPTTKTKMEFKQEMEKFSITINAKKSFPEMKHYARQQLNYVRADKSRLRIAPSSSSAIAGSGLKVRKPRVTKSKELQPLGNAFYDPYKLQELNTLSLYKTATGGKMMKDEVLSEPLVHSIAVGKPVGLDEEELNWYDWLAKKVRITPAYKPKAGKMKVPTAETNKKRLRILMGERDAGNDNPEIMKELKKLVMFMDNNHQLTKSQLQKLDDWFLNL